MSLQETKQNCVVCHAYLFEDDEVVYCPICGAPHHRECYNSIGHCAMEQYHGTDKEYKKPVIQQKNEDAVKKINQEDKGTKECIFCKKEIEKDAKMCPYCGRPNVAGVHFAFDMSGGVADNEDLGDGVTAAEVKPLVAVNTQRYLPKFLKFKNGSKTSWNWMAFLFPQGWFFSRKMYKVGLLVTAIILAFQICLFPINSVLEQNVFNNYNEIRVFLTNYFSECLANGNYLPLLSATVAGLGPVAVRVVSALYGDKIYYSHTLARVKDKKHTPLIDEDYYHKFGGVNIIAFFLGVMALNYLPGLIFALFQSF